MAQSDFSEAQRIIYLTAQFINGGISFAEMQELDAWKNEAPGNRLLFDELVNGQNRSAAVERMTRYPAEEALERLHSRMEEAAAKGKSNLLRTGIAAASIGLIVFFSYLYFPSIRNWIDPVKYQTVTTLRGQLKQLKLADGTQVWLNPGSSLSYPERFREATREVHLSGEAFFDVAHDREHPFIVVAGQLSTQVLGTRFNIQAYRDREATEVTLVSGKVSVTDTNRKIFLQSNEQAVFNGKLRTLVKRSYPEAADYLQRRDGKLVYHAAPLFKVVNDIRLFFNVEVDLDGRMAGCLFVGDFGIGDGAEAALQQLALSSGARMERTPAGAYKIWGGTCP